MEAWFVVVPSVYLYGWEKRLGGYSSLPPLFFVWNIDASMRHKVIIVVWGRGVYLALLAEGLGICGWLARAPLWSSIFWPRWTNAFHGWLSFLPFG